MTSSVGQLHIDQVRVERELGKRSLHAFVRMAFHVIEPGEEFVDGRHLEEVCKHLEACHRGEIRQLAICIPPGCMKSIIVSILFPVWSWLQDGSIRFAVIGYDGELTGTRDGGKVINLITSNWFRDRWGDMLDTSEPAKSNIITTSAGFRYATSIGGAYTGRHVHYELGDDLLNAKQLSRAKIEELRTWRTRVAPTRTLPWRQNKPGARIYINQRLHEDDAVGQAEEEERQSPGSWTFLTLPMEFDPEASCKTRWGGDWRTEKDELLWPQRFNASLVRDRKGIMGPKDSAAQFQQRPVPDGGLVFSEKTFKDFTRAPSRFDEIVLSVDATFKDAQNSDLVCIGVIGRVGPDYYVLDLDWRRMSFTATLDAIRAMVRKWPRVRAKLIEDKANGSAIIDTLKKEISGIIAVQPEGGKEARANAIEPFFSAGNVWFPSLKGACIQPERSDEVVYLEWVQRLRLELLGFPMGKHDDGVDMLSQSLLYFRTKRSRWLEAMTKITQQKEFRTS